MNHDSPPRPPPWSPTWLGPYGGRGVRALLAIGFAAGLPLLLVGGTLSAWLASERVDLGEIGLLSLVGLPYSLKFLWAPLLDRFAPPVLGRRWGRRQGWLALLQLLLAAALLALGSAEPRRPLLAVLALLVAFLAASQDVVADAYRADLLRPAERAAGSASYVLGYRVAMVAAGTLALVLSEHLPWRAVYGAMAALMLLLVPLTLRAPAVPATAVPPSLRAAIWDPLRALFDRHDPRPEGPAGALRLLVGVALYKVGETLVLGMQTPFLLHLGFSRGAVGTLANGVGLGATLIGALTGGVLVPRLGLRRSLLLFGAAQATANLGYAVLAASGASRPLLLLVVVLDNLCGGLGSTAFVAFLMGLCQARHSATQYALLSSLSGVVGRLAGGGAGYLALRLGWPRFFLLTTLLALPGLWLLGIRPGGR